MTGGNQDSAGDGGPEPAFAFLSLSKYYEKKRALDEVTLAVPPGSVVGLVGRNGAGKSTAIRCLLGLQRPSFGKVRLLGHDPVQLPAPIKQRIGYMSDAGLPFPGVRPDDLFGFLAPLYPGWDLGLQHDLVRRFQISPRVKIAKHSLGQQRAVALIAALCPRPDLLVLDEPAANLDAVMRREFLKEVLELVADQGRTVLLSSHNLADIERIADQVAFLHHGRLLLHRPLDDLQERTRRLRLRFPGEAPLRLEIPGSLRTRRSGRELLITVDGFQDTLLDGLRAQLGGEVAVEAHPLSLEELFIDLVGPEPDADGEREAA